MNQDLAVIIPSCTLLNLTPCIQALRDNDDVTVIVVTNLAHQRYREMDHVYFIDAPQPFSFAASCNAGIKAAESRDVILLNDDALLSTRFGLSELHSVHKQHPNYGVIAAVCNNVGNPNQQASGPSSDDRPIRDDPRMVCFVCVSILRSTINTVGLLDERFIDYGLDDDDYCLRVRNAGLKIGIFDGCFVDHATLPSTYRSTGRGDYRPNLRRFIEKWGVDNWGRNKEESGFKELFP